MRNTGYKRNKEGKIRNDCLIHVEENTKRKELSTGAKESFRPVPFIAWYYYLVYTKELRYREIKDSVLLS